jgi:hypothetical protein
VQTQLVISRELGLGDRQQLVEVDGLSQEIARMLVAMIQKL